MTDHMTDEHEVAHRRLPRHRNGGWILALGKDLLKLMLAALVGYAGALVQFSSALSSLQQSDREWRYVQCNGVLSERARAAVPFCRDVPIAHPSYRRMFRDTS